MSITPLYDKAKRAIAECNEWADEGFPGATLKDLARMAGDYGPESDAANARVRAEKNCMVMLVCMPIKAELDAAGLAPEYRMAVYKERLGVKKAGRLMS